ncbi:hypothetical protein FZZ91_05840 [Synechococcus sp. HB1133]|uniref:hypothetical protein n=1 Tax=unclassified Synechococcus TaxID=2626047 RepID=UPI001409BFE7|nr:MULTISPECIES: hypothetical protein [unclassified Synechococcus]MCB4422359.1 hypothetical protein [Synechococcus sp. HB1133]MCB4429537.1 hypothetical protein [Synechococcus sp. HBA1120]NHI81303.1 hypothetical protein [Synechococcus sp. HB1133]
MSIDARCKEQQQTADRMFMDFKYTAPGSKEQVRALTTLSFLVGMWADFLTAEEKRMASALALETNR